MMKTTSVTKEEYAIQAFNLAEKNHIWINAFGERDNKFFESLGRMVYAKLESGKLLQSVSFGEKTNIEIPGKTCFIEINQS